MTKFQKPANIENLADLRLAKKAVQADIQFSLQKLKGTVSDIPNRLLVGTITIVAGAIAIGILKRILKKKHAKAAAKTSAHSEPENFGQTLKYLGGKTAWFVVTKLVEKLIPK